MKLHKKMISQRPGILILGKTKKNTKTPYLILSTATEHLGKWYSATYTAFFSSELHDGEVDPNWFLEENQCVEGDLIKIKHPPRFKGTRMWSISKTAYIGQCTEEKITAFVRSRYPDFTEFCTLQTRLGDPALWDPEAKKFTFNVTSPRT